MATLTILGAFSYGITIVYDTYALSYDILRLSSPSLRNIAGEKINTVETGQQTVLTISMHNNLEREQAFVILIEIRDSTGITHQLYWQSGIIAANGDYTMGISWMPQHVCWELTSHDNICFDNYEIRTFALTSLENPQVLSAVSRLDGIKVIGLPPSPPLNQYQFELTLKDGRKYTIDYSFSKGEGKITNIKFTDDKKTKSAIFVLSSVSENSRFTITMPSFLYNHLFVNNEENNPVQIEAFVDGRKATSFSLPSSAGTSTLVFSLKQGTEEVKITGTPVL